MAIVCQCDACGAVAPYTRVHRIRVNDFDKQIRENAIKYSVDVCPACYSKLQEILKTGGKKNAE